jgi:hypothetical protein
MDGTTMATDISIALRAEEPIADDGEVGKFEESQKEVDEVEKNA